MKPIHWVILFAIIFAVASCEEEPEFSSKETVLACNFIRQALHNDQDIISGQNQKAAEINKRIAAKDPAYGEVVSEYPELRLGILLGDNWENHALRMISMYSKAAKMLPEGNQFSETLDDSSLVWYKRLILKQTAPGQAKRKLSMEQIKLDTREGGVNRRIIRDTCAIPRLMLP